MNVYRSFGKRTLDLVAATCLAAVLMPVVLAIAAVVRVRIGSPVLFRQVRPGRRGQPFTILKFRTMHADDRGDGSPCNDEQRLTSLGRQLRAWSLDELPELWNVLRGDMSLVGPRPLLPEYLAHYTDEQARRHEVRPGITGWAQINGRNALTWPQKFAHDVWYVDNLSLALDLRILATTAWWVVTRQGISAKGHATMPKFDGSET